MTKKGVSDADGFPKVSETEVPRRKKIKLETLFGDSPGASALLIDLGVAYGCLAQGLAVSTTTTTTTAPTEILYAVFQMYDVAAVADDDVSLCGACAWLTTVMCIVGSPSLANRFSQLASTYADLNPIDKCIAPASYAQMFYLGGEGRLKDAAHSAARAAASYLAIGDMRRMRECTGIQIVLLRDIGRLQEGHDIGNRLLSDAYECGDLDVVEKVFASKSNVLVLLGKLDEGIAACNECRELNRRSQKNDGKQKDIVDRPRSTSVLAHCYLGNHELAEETYYTCLAEGVTTFFFWSGFYYSTIGAGLWEILNHSAVKGKPITSRLASAKEVTKKMLTKTKSLGLKAASPVVSFNEALDRFTNFDADYAAIQELFAKTQLTESNVMVALSKFYAVLAKVVYEVRADRGITNKRVGSGSLKTAWTKPQNVVQSEMEVIKLRGENLGLIKDAIEYCKVNDIGLYSGLVEKVLAIDNGVGVLVQWGEAP